MAKTRSMKTKMELQHSLQFLEVDLKKAKTKSEIAKIEKKIKDTKEKISKKGGRRETRHHTRRH
jgi:uncharacterized protein YeeX (DUF496 family)